MPCFRFLKIEKLLYDQAKCNEVKCVRVWHAACNGTLARSQIFGTKGADQSVNLYNETKWLMATGGTV